MAQKFLKKAQHKEALRTRKRDQRGHDDEDDPNLPRCAVPVVACGRIGEHPPVDKENGVKMTCTNPKCPLASQLLHAECFEKLERELLKRLGKEGSARGWTEQQRQHNLWRHKGLSLIQRFITCRCEHGQMTKDLEEEASVMPPPSAPGKKKKKDLPALNSGKLNGVSLSTVLGSSSVQARKKFFELDSYGLEASEESEQECVVQVAPPVAARKNRRGGRNKKPTEQTQSVSAAVAAIKQKPAKPSVKAPVEYGRPPDYLVNFDASGKPASKPSAADSTKASGQQSRGETTKSDGATPSRKKAAAAKKISGPPAVNPWTLPDAAIRVGAAPPRDRAMSMVESVAPEKKAALSEKLVVNVASGASHTMVTPVKKKLDSPDSRQDSVDSAIGSASRNSTPSLGNSPPPAEDVGAHEDDPVAEGAILVCGPIGDGVGLRSKMNQSWSSMVGAVQPKATSTPFSVSAAAPKKPSYYSLFSEHSPSFHLGERLLALGAGFMGSGFGGVGTGLKTFDELFVSI
ncbi:hypothetical protein AAVH_17552 [Aphelenchoides avenae]|nr:hypothetical protein AAVH_17552 [Aphelenchus avenae]